MLIAFEQTLFVAQVPSAALPLARRSPGDPGYSLMLLSCCCCCIGLHSNGRAFHGCFQSAVIDTAGCASGVAGGATLKVGPGTALEQGSITHLNEQVPALFAPVFGAEGKRNSRVHQVRCRCLLLRLVDYGLWCRLGN